MLPDGVQIGSNLVMYTPNNDNIGTTINYWTSPTSDGIHWTLGSLNSGVSLAAPISSDWEYTNLYGIIDSWTIKNSHGFYERAYTAARSSPSPPQTIGYAVSADGYQFWRYQTAPILNASGLCASLSSGQIGDTTFIENSGSFKVGVTCDNGSNTAFGASATMTDY
jgi:hypothetical protein